LSAEVARQLRVQYPGALYHIIDRGAYQSDGFETGGAATAFMRTLTQACERYGWDAYAYVLMRNHYHRQLAAPLSLPSRVARASVRIGRGETDLARRDQVVAISPRIWMPALRACPPMIRFCSELWP
jgi:hypothetical protein